jgi:hypothetical protein
MPIELDNQVVVPAVVSAEKTADRLWIQNLFIMADNPAEPVTAQINVAPFNSATGELIKEGQTQITISDVVGQCGQDETLAAAMNAIYAAVHRICQVRGLYGLSLPAVPPEPTEEQ